MKLDINNKQDEYFCFSVEVWDDDTGEKISRVIAGDESTGQIIRHEYPFRILPDDSLARISEFRNFYFVITDPVVRIDLPHLTGYQGGIIVNLNHPGAGAHQMPE